ncbi:hypothetical protein L1D14_07510 [Vibrio tubiashii]|uniref:hypothetical protein n=1 Tax=Vibrio tubiashii TaxID=29498 RepID=UPI001EFE9ECB|nr:hypothetical protein [Vibrio tubiashii]MCG9576085.1 hypothetical protein [Vibrio tubiashii]
MTKHLTVVFRFDEQSDLVDQITRNFHEENHFHGLEIVAISSEDEISRVEELEKR